MTRRASGPNTVLTAASTMGRYLSFTQRRWNSLGASRLTTPFWMPAGCKPSSHVCQVTGVTRPRSVRRN